MSLQKMSDQDCFASFIDGVFRFDETQPIKPLISPATKQPWKDVCQAPLKLTKEAIAAADRALPAWKATPAPKRSQYLRKIGELMIANKQLLAQTMAMEMGKPVKEGVNEVDYAAGFYFWFAGEAERLYGQLIPSSQPNKQLMLMYEPVGICGIITPWNFPLAMGARKIAAALAAGCTVVSKPSPECPVSASLLADLCRQAELPHGVFNVVIGPEKEVGQQLLTSPLVRKISFTGSCAVGKYLYRESAETMKKLTLELGGQAPLLVFDDADLNIAVEGTIIAKLRNNGQTCIAANRLLIQKGIYQAYLDKLLAAIDKLAVGSPLEPNTDISTVLHPASAARVAEHIDDALKKGAKPLLLGDKPYLPTVLTGITPEMRIFREETFGPVLAITAFDTIHQGLALANDCEYGLAAYAFTKSLAQAHLCMASLQYGIIGINDGLPSAPQAAFGGVKNSGLGREGGPTGLHEYLVEKYVSMVF